MAKSPKLHVKVFSMFTTLYDDDADSVSAKNNTGPFDVLPGHANFLSVINPGDLVIRNNNEEYTKLLDVCVMRVSENKVTVFLDT